MTLENLQQLADRKNGRFMLRYHPHDKEKWGIKFFPDIEDDAHYFAYGETLEATVHQIISEMEGFN